MRESQSIKKANIDTFLENNLNKYIENIITQIADIYQFISEEEAKALEEFLIEIKNFLNSNILNLVVTELKDRKFDFKDLSSDLDMITTTVDPDNGSNSNVNPSELVRGVVRLLVSKELLNIQSFLSVILDKKSYDVFLSHCSWDAREILGLKLILEFDYTLNTYVDWIDDKQANFPRAIKKVMDVIKDIAKSILGFELNKFEKIFSRRLKDIGIKGRNSEKCISDIIIKNLKRSKSVFYVQSRHYDHSRWMPWELGLADASKIKIYRLPIKYVRARKKYGKRNGFLVRYESIINNKEKLDKTELKSILSK